MAEFGTPIRSATSDANAGVVNPPAKQHIARNTVGTSSKTLSGSDKAIAAIGRTVGSALGNALASMQTDETNQINEQRVIEASARQGIETAMNEVDQVKKRTGWEKGVFGENIEYRAAQQRAVQNKVQATYLEELAGIDGYAGDTPEQYHIRQQKKNASILKEYAEDPDTRLKVQSALAASGQKLAQAHYKSHYAYNQLQQQETERTRLQQTFDGFNLEATTLLTQEAKASQLKDIKSVFNGNTKPEGMTKLAHRALIFDVVKANMKAGNAGAMLAVKGLGMDKNFSASEQAEWDVAVSAYDTHFSQQADLIRTNGDIQINTAITPEQVNAAAAEKNTELDELFKKSSGSQRSSLIMARGNLDVSTDKKAIAKQVLARKTAFDKAVAKATVASDVAVLADMGIASENMKQAIDLATTPEEQQAAIEAYNATLAELVSGLTPTTANILKMEKLDTAASTAQQALRKEQAKTLAAAEKKKLELEEQATKDANIAEYFATNEPARKGALQSEGDLTKKEKEQGFDTHLIKGAKQFIGGEDLPTAEEFGRALQTNPKLQAWVLEEMKRTGETSPLLQSNLVSAVDATDRLYDADGSVTEIGRQTVAMVDKLTQSDKGVDLIGGKDAYRQWRITARGVTSGAGQKNTARKIEHYLANKGKQDAAGFRWKDVIGNDTRKGWMVKKLGKMGIHNPSAQMVSDSLYDYREDITAFGGDTKEADNSLWHNTQNNKTKVFNSNLVNAKSINDATKWTVENFITTADKYNKLTGKYVDITGRSKVIHSHKELPNLQWYTKPGEDGIFASSPSEEGEMFISVDEMKDIEASITELQETAQGVQSRRGAAAIRRLVEKQTLTQAAGRL